MNRKRTLLLFLLGICIAMSAHSLPQIAILKTLLASGIDPTVEPLLTAKIEEAYVRSGRYQVLDRANVDQVLQEKEFQLSSGLVSNEELRQAGDYLGADLVVVAQASRIGQVYALSAKVIDVTTGQIAAQSSAEQQGKIEVLLELAREVGADLAGSRGVAKKEAVKKEPKPRPAKAEAEPAKPYRHTILAGAGADLFGYIFCFGADYFYRFSNRLSATGALWFGGDSFVLATAGISAAVLPWLDLGLRVGYAHFMNWSYDDLANGLAISPVVLIRFGRWAVAADFSILEADLPTFVFGGSIGLSF